MQTIYIITGANGFLGNNLVRTILQKSSAKSSTAQPNAIDAANSTHVTKPTIDQVEVRALVSSPDRAEALQGLDCKIYPGDITKLDTLTPVFQVPKDAKVYVIHCAAIVYIKSQPNPKVYQVNVGGTHNIVEKTLEIGAKLVQVSSVHAIPVLPRPQTMTEVNHFDPRLVEGEYAKSKAEAAQYVLDAVEKRGLDACIVHPSGIIGPYDFKISHLTQMVIDVATGRLKAGVDGGYDFVDVRDVAKGILSACTKGKPGECYLLTGHYCSVPELLNSISSATNTKPIKTILPMWLAKATAPLAEAYYSWRKTPPLYTKYSLFTLSSNANFSHAKATAELNYNPRPLANTIRDTVAWLREANKIPPLATPIETTK